MARIDDAAAVEQNYRRPENLNTRIDLHRKYGQYPRGTDAWFPLYHFFPGCRVLELGCGTGAMWACHIAALPEGVRLTLADLSPGMVDSARESYAHLPQVETRVMDIQRLDCPPESYDIVIANAMLYHVPDVPLAIAQVHRALRPGGVFYASTFGQDGMPDFFARQLAAYRSGLRAFAGAGQAFHMGNGRALLKAVFADVVQYTFRDALEVTDTADIVAYLLSSTSFAGLDAGEAPALQAFFDGLRDARGIVRIPRHYGTFVAQKAEAL